MSTEHDMQQFLRSPGAEVAPPERPGVPPGLGAFLGAVVAAASQESAEAVAQLSCREAGCSGRVWISQALPGERIGWLCPRCDDQGFIRGWERTPWDRRPARPTLRLLDGGLRGRGGGGPPTPPPNDRPPSAAPPPRAVPPRRSAPRDVPRRTDPARADTPRGAPAIAAAQATPLPLPALAADGPGGGGASGSPGPAVARLLVRPLFAEGQLVGAGTWSLAKEAARGTPAAHPRFVTPDELREVLDALGEEALLVGLGLEDLVRALDPDRPPRTVCLERHARPRTLRSGRTPRPRLETVIAHTIRSPTSRPLATPERLVGWARAAGSAARAQLAERLALDLRALFAFYRYGVLHGAVRLRHRRGQDEALAVEWRQVGDPCARDLLERAWRDERPLEVVLAPAPLGPDPWAGALRGTPYHVDDQGASISWEDDEDDWVSHDELVSVRLLGQRGWW